ncbi:hypothetical protein CAPTEDRAFT_150088 [Capitella teleta]|uniref:Cyclin N-terminal domain-containing protein n=1 Tax=Capitella teleta TaxID=283909 RepID=R7T3T1_CAPTE|nr:hypothetical protein CAPTEDRAFT_150088 [Capitella teleta]|eukprot:ELT87331.1 hypothetical protein CAPTEDRAFT_150088 [Capitella teleta]
MNISPLKNNITPAELVRQESFRGNRRLFTPSPNCCMSPLPSLEWADSKEVWQLMLRKEAQYSRDPNMLHRHPGLQPRMRAILLDWLIEVCEVYRLHRETFYLATDFIDRYLSITEGVEKQQLQLMGITALFIAAKLEEIYPPKIGEFAYVTDGACTDDCILEQELVMLKALKWDLSPMTPNSWLNIYLQLINVDREASDEPVPNFVFPKYSSHAFVQIARLLDLCTLDIECLHYPYSILTSSALYHMSSDRVALAVSGYTWTDIAACVQWMAPYATTLRDTGVVELKFYKQIPAETTHNIQSHVVDLCLLEKAQMLQAKMSEAVRSSPDLSREFPGLITPPQSTKGKGKLSLHPPVAPGLSGL